jgi:hypothetical protein
VGLVIEFERVIGVREVFIRLFFDFQVGFDPIKKPGAVARLFGISGLIGFKSFVMPNFFFLRGLAIAGQRAGEIVATDESSCVQSSAADHNSNTGHVYV